MGDMKLPGEGAPNMVSVRVQTCKNCKHSLNLNTNTVECRRYPPDTHLRDLFQGTQDGGAQIALRPMGQPGMMATISESITQFPRMKDDVWCGEWTTRIALH